jgi:hypothetical protein
MPLLHSGPFQRLIPDVRPFGIFGVSRFAWSLAQSFLTTSSLCHATVARLVVYLPVTVNRFRGP